MAESTVRHAPRGAALLLGALALGACSSSSSPVSAGADAVGSSGSAGTGDAGGDDPTSCASYCTDITAICKGPNAQYRDMADCLKACSYLPAGKPDDTGVNSIGCRHNYTIDAAFDSGPIKTHCWQAGPLGYGACGPETEPFCAIAVHYCSAAEGYTGTPPYTSLDECETYAAQLPRVLTFGAPGSYGVSYSPGPTADTTDTLECRAYHLIVNALKDEMFQQIHCPHAAPVSEVCGPGIKQAEPPGDAGSDAPGTDAT